MRPPNPRSIRIARLSHIDTRERRGSALLSHCIGKCRLPKGELKSAASGLSRIGVCSLYAASEVLPITPGLPTGPTSMQRSLAWRHQTIITTFDRRFPDCKPQTWRNPTHHLRSTKYLPQPNSSRKALPPSTAETSPPWTSFP